MSAVKALFIGTGVLVAFLMLYTFGVALTAYRQATPYVEREYPTMLIDQQEVCETPCTRPASTHTFSAPEGANRISMQVHVAMDAMGGGVRVRILDPQGDVRFERTFTASTEDRTFDESATWSYAGGTWTYELAPVGFQGRVETEVWSLGLPPGSL